MKIDVAKPILTDFELLNGEILLFITRLLITMCHRISSGKHTEYQADIDVVSTKTMRPVR